MSKVFTIIIIIGLIFGGYSLYNYYRTVEQDTDGPVVEEVEIHPTSLPGMPYQLEESLRFAQEKGYRGMKEWLEAYGPHLQDPRKAWIELDYLLYLSREDPAAARKLYADIKNRTPRSSPVYPRVQKLSRTYE